jgi:uncharacterized integral membrane protein
MEPVNPDGPVTSVTIGPASPIPFIVTGIAVVLAVGVLVYVTVCIVRTIRRRRLVKQVQQSQIRVLWGGQ